MSKKKLIVGTIVRCNGELDEIVGLVDPKDKENFDAGYRYILKNHGTQSEKSIEEVEESHLNKR